MVKTNLQLVVNLPTDQEIMKIPLARHVEWDLTDKEAQRVRSRIYGINKHNAANRRYRTMRDGSLLLVWRIR